MEERTFTKALGGNVVIDLCHGCDGIWFDLHENLQLSPRGTLELFKAIHDQHRKQRAQLADAMACPRCSAALVHTHDLVRNTRFSYLACPENHGRFITFFQFLREKNFVHQLNPKELAELKAKVGVIHCSNCGAPVDLHTSMKCEHCQAAISVIDPGRVKKLLEELIAKADPAKTQKPPELVAMELELQKMRVEEIYRGLDRQTRGYRPSWRNDLVDVGIGAVGAILRGFLS